MHVYMQYVQEDNLDDVDPCGERYVHMLGRQKSYFRKTLYTSTYGICWKKANVLWAFYSNVYGLKKSKYGHRCCFKNI